MRIPMVKKKMGFGDKKFVKEYNNKRETLCIGGKTCNFRSQLEVKTAQYLQLLKDNGHIKDWAYEQTRFEFPDSKYLIDFDVLNNDGSFFYIESKGYMDAQAKRKLKMLNKYYPHAIVDMVFSNRSDIKRLKTAVKYIRRATTINELTKGLL